MSGKYLTSKFQITKCNSLKCGETKSSTTTFLLSLSRCRATFHDHSEFLMFEIFRNFAIISQ